MNEELYFNDELRKCLNAAGLSDCGENDEWNYWYHRVHKAHDQAVDRVTEAQRAENAKLREEIEAAKHDLQVFSRGSVQLEAENAKLRERVDAAHMSRLLTENENESLRELVRDMWRDGMCECDERGACAQCEYHFLDRMRGLGIEVNDV